MRCNGEEQTEKPSIEKNFSQTSINEILTCSTHVERMNPQCCMGISQTRTPSLDIYDRGDP